MNIFVVRSHHQNSNVERKIQTITQGSRKLRLHAKTYWLGTITTVL